MTVYVCDSTGGMVEVYSNNTEHALNADIILGQRIRPCTNVKSALR